MNQTVKAQFPYPLARKYAFIYERSSGYLEMFTRTLDCLETLVRFCTALLVCEYARADAGVRHEETSRGVFELLRNPRTSTGHWVAALRSLCAHLVSHRHRLFMPELPGLYFERPGRLTTCARQVLESFPADRNRFLAHKTRAYSEREYKQLFDQYESKLAMCFESLGFLVNYLMIVPTRIRAAAIEEWLEARGAGAFEVRRGGAIPLDDVGSVEGDLDVLLVDGSTPSKGRPLLASPLFLYRYWFDQDTDDVYVFGAVTTSPRREIAEVQYFGSAKHSEPLTVSPRDHLSVVFEAFLGLLSPLAGSSEQPQVRASTPAVPPYPAIQRTIIERHSRFFVARPEVDARVDDFLAGHASGYCVLVGVPGQGKTALTARYVAEHGWVHHFVQISDPEGRRWDRIVRSLLWQMAQLHGLDLEIPLTDEDLLKCYHETLAMAARTADRKVVIVIDALDELSEAGDCRLDFLPSILPENVYFIISSREGDELNLLRRRASRSNVLCEIPVPPLSRAQVEEFFGDVIPPPPMNWSDLLEMSEGNPLFLREIKGALEADGHLAGGATTPTLEHYFSANLDRIGFDRSELMLRAACTIAVSVEPIPLLHLARILGERERVVANEALRPLAQYLVRDGDTYAIYHRRFRDYLLRSQFGSDDVADAREAILAYCEPCEQKGHWYALASAPELLLAQGRYGRVLELAASEAFCEALQKHVDYYQMCKRVLELLDRVWRTSAEHADQATGTTLAFLKYVGHFAHDYALFDLIPELMTRLESSATAGTADERTHVYLMKGDHLYLNCRYSEALAAFSTALRELEAASPKTRAELFHRLLQLVGLTHRRLAQSADADEFFGRAAEAAAAVGNLFFQADIWVCLAISETQQEDFEAAEAHYARGIAALSDLIGRFDELGAHEKDGLKDVLHAKANLASYYTYQTLCFIASGRIEAAHASVTESEALYRDLEGASGEYTRHHYERFLYAKAWVLGLLGRVTEAESLARESLRRADRAVDRAYALYILGGLLLRSGPQSSGAAEGRVVLEESITLFSNMGMTHETERARRDLRAFAE